MMSEKVKEVPPAEVSESQSKNAALLRVLDEWETMPLSDEEKKLMDESVAVNDRLKGYDPRYNLTLDEIRLCREALFVSLAALPQERKPAVEQLIEKFDRLIGLSEKLGDEAVVMKPTV